MTILEEEVEHAVQRGLVWLTREECIARYKTDPVRYPVVHSKLRLKGAGVWERVFLEDDLRDAKPAR